MPLEESSDQDVLLAKKPNNPPAPAGPDRDRARQHSVTPVTKGLKGLFMVNADGRRLYCKYWAKEAAEEFTPKALVFIVHGYAEHCLRYTQLAHCLMSRNFIPFAHDHVGHGQSDGSMVEIAQFDILVRDVLQHIKLMQGKYPELPMYVIGHSMGGCIALRAYLQEPALIKKLVLIGAAIIPFRQMKNICLFLLLKFLGTFLPEIPIFMKIDVKQLTTNKQQIALLKTDPLIYNGYMKAGFIKVFVDALYNLESNLHKIKCPLLILHGGQDQIVAPEHSRALYEKSTSEDKTLRIFPELCHQLHAEREPDGGFIRQEIAEWLLTNRQQKGEEDDGLSILTTKTDIKKKQ